MECSVFFLLNLVIIKMRNSRESCHSGEFNEDIFSRRTLGRGFLRRRKFVFGTEGLRLEDVVLPHHTLVALVGHHQHGHLGGGEISLQSESC